MNKPIIYSTPTCTYCHTLKNWFKTNQIEYQERIVGVDILSDEFVELTGQMGVPVTEVNGKFVVGFNPDAIQKLLS